MLGAKANIYYVLVKLANWQRFISQKKKKKKAEICIERSMMNKQTFCLFYLFVRKTLYYRKCFILLLSISKKKAFYSGRLIHRRVKIGVSIKHTWKSELHMSAWIKFFIIIAPHFDHLSIPSEILFQVHTLLV